MSETKENSNQKYTRRAEYASLALGMALLTFWGAARVESIINSRAALGKFDAFESRASVSADSTHAQGGASRALETILSPWEGKKVQAQIESPSERTDVPLAVPSDSEDPARSASA